MLDSAETAGTYHEFEQGGSSAAYYYNTFKESLAPCVGRQVIPAFPHSDGTESYKSRRVPNELEEEFRTLASKWRIDTQYLSAISDIVMHPAYQRIMAMGEDVIPLILQELSERPSHWFWALHFLTNADPVPETSRGRVGEMNEAWIKWGRSRGLV